VAEGEAFTPRGNVAAPKVEPADKAPIPVPIDPPGPSRKKVPRENRGKNRPR
jgi:hypothetical protein